MTSYRKLIIKIFFWDLFVNEVFASYFFPFFLRKYLLKIFGFKNIQGIIHSKCYFGSNRFSLGSNSYVNRECFFDNENGASINIGNNCSIGYRAIFLTTNHDYSNTNKRGGKVFSKPITIGDGTWIGARATILPGITIGRGCVIAAGSVVTKNLESDGIYAGVPAKLVKKMIK